MTEGWFGDDYLILFEDRASGLDRAYGLSDALPGYRLVGLRGWDDFLVEDSTGACFTVPTVPIVQEHLAPFTIPKISAKPEPDAKVRGRIKWYVKPIALGGDPQLPDNIAWITLEQHTELVTWWNRKYHEVREGSDGKPAA
jgi:hypothetical protein